MANIAISSLPTGTATGGEIFVGNQSGTTKALSLGMDALSDYETGTWTPTIVGDTVAGANTYSLQGGGYNKIGNLIVANFFLTLSTLNSTGTLNVSGLPFTCANEFRNTNAFYFQNLTGFSTSDPTGIIGIVKANATEIQLRYFAGNFLNTLQNTNVNTSSFDLRGNIQYFTT